jgi:hypothetical protein
VEHVAPDDVSPFVIDDASNPVAVARCEGHSASKTERVSSPS